MKNLLKINLEQELIQENKQSLLTPYELLLINQFETLGQLESNDVLQRLGMVHNLSRGKQLLQQIDNFKQQTVKFDQKRVFHVSQIEKICDKYRLKFLPIKYYSGQIDTELPQKITNFELIYETSVTSNNSFIIAPKNSFRLEERPKDPLFFYKINDEYYYLIHKWGKDLSILNRIKAILYNNVRKLITLLLVSIPVIFGTNPVSVTIIIVGGIIWGVEYLSDTPEPDSLFPKFIYNSMYRD